MLGASESNPNGAYIGWGSAEIMLEFDDMRYGQARISAFHRALTDAKIEYGKYKNTSISSNHLDSKTQYDTTIEPGFRILANFEDDRSVGVLVIHEEKSRELAEHIAMDGLHSPTKKDVNFIKNLLSDILPEQTDYLLMHGLRIINLDSGESVILSFGQWAPMITSKMSHTERKEQIETAYKIAHLHAADALRNFAFGFEVSGESLYASAGYEKNGTEAVLSPTVTGQGILHHLGAP